MTGPGDNILISWAADLDDLEGQIETLQDAKRDLYATIREEHGRVVADALKNSLRILRMDAEKRARVAEVDAETEKLLAAIEASRTRSARAPRVATTVPVTVEEADTTPSIGDVSPGPQSPDEAAADASEGGEHEEAVATTGLKNTASEAEAIAEPSVDTETTVERDGASALASVSDVEPVAPIPEPPVRSFNPQTHFKNSQGLHRLHGCQEPEACAGSWRELCHGCRRVVEAA